MLTGDQKALIKQAQREAGIDDAEYREAIGTVLPGADSSTDPRLTDGHLDRLLAYFEAICWRKRDAKEPGMLRAKVFRARNYWALKNRTGHTSRDRFTTGRLQNQIRVAEDRLLSLGKDKAYLGAIQGKTGPGWPYLMALRRAVEAAQKKIEALQAAQVISPRTPVAAPMQEPVKAPSRPVRTYQLKPFES
jgi:hypothetical protein